MPPQQENENTADAAPATAAADATSSGIAVAGASSSYWENPAEKELEGKRLSKLDLSSLEHQHIADSDKDGKEEKPKDEQTDDEEKPEYWDAPAEKALDGKRLSKLDLSNMEHQRVEDDAPAAESSDMQPANKRKSFGAYWEWQNEQFKKTLSNLSLSNLAKQHDGTESTAPESENGATPAAAVVPTPSVQGANYWEWQGEKMKQTLSNLSLSNLAKGSRAHEQGNGDDDDESAEGGMGQRRQSNGSYWFWRNASMRSMDASNASLTALEQAAKDGDAAAQNNNSSERSTGSAGSGSGSPSRRSSTGGGSYWFWKGGSSTNNLNASNASLTALDKEVKDSENAKNKPTEDGNSSTGFPITNLQHKLRNSWRQSFQRFSTNSLRGLDEHSAVGDDNKKGWKEAMSGKSKLAGMDDSFEGGSCGSSIGEEDAITF